MAAKAHHFSSDTVDAISDLQAVANEAIILQQRVAQEQTNKQKRLQRASRYKVKMTLKSKDKQFQTANTLEDMRVAHEAKQALIEETALYQQEKFVRDAWYRDKNQAIQRWRETEGMPNGIKIQQKRYLEDLGFTPENVPAVRERPGKGRRPIHSPHSHGSSIKGQFQLEIQVPRSILPWIPTLPVLSAYAYHDPRNQPHLPPQTGLPNRSHGIYHWLHPLPVNFRIRDRLKTVPRRQYRVVERMSWKYPGRLVTA